MKNSYELGQERFDALLRIFSVNREEAGVLYEQVRLGLLNYFTFKGCGDAESLADETIDRVAARLNKFDASRNTELLSFIHGFAAKILMEYRRNAGSEIEFITDHADGRTSDDSESRADRSGRCLNECLNKCSRAEVRLIIEYFSREGPEKIELRKNMCRRLKCSAANLHVQIFRIRRTLRTCIENCLKKNV